MKKCFPKGNRLLFGIMIALVAGLASPALTTPVYAQPGTLIQAINPPMCPNTATFGGIGVAYDGNRIIYTCVNFGNESDPAFYFTNLAGANLGSQNIVDVTGAPIGMDAIVWDPSENRMWGGDLDKVNGLCAIYRIDMTVNPAVATQQFTFAAAGCAGMGFNFYDGITIDPVTNTLYLSPDIQPLVQHFDKSGNPLADDPINVGALIGVNTLSGLAMGLDQTLYVGTNGAGLIFQVDPFTPASLGQFATFAGRDEGMECGPLVGGKETLLVRGFNVNVIDVLEVAPGTCVSPSIPVGGEILPINSVALMITGISSSAMWLISLVAIGGGAFALLRFQVLKGKN